MDTILTIASFVVGLVSVFVTIRKRDLSKRKEVSLLLVELALMAVAVVQLGWLGAVIVAAATVLAVLIDSVRLAIRLDDDLTYAATQAKATKAEMKALHQRLLHRSHKAFMVLGPIRLGELIKYVADRNRSVSEMEDMVPPIVMLWAIYRPDLADLAARFDQLLRLYGKPASQATQVSDTLTAATMSSAVTFDEMLTGMIAAAS